MARVTVEDCLKNVKNRFELVIVAAKRARQLMRGKEAKVDWDNDKPTVVALREIAAGFKPDEDDHHHHHEETIIQVAVVKPVVVEEDEDEDLSDGQELMGTDILEHHEEVPDNDHETRHEDDI